MNDEIINQRLLACSTRYHDHLMEDLRDPQEAAIYLQVALDEYQEDGDTEAFMLALRNIAQATGGIGELAKKAELNRQNLYRTLSSKGNPSLKMLQPILDGLGFHLFVGLKQHTPSQLITKS